MTQSKRGWQRLRETRLADFSAVVERFPVPVALMAIFTIIFIVFDSYTVDSKLALFMAGLIIASYLSVIFTVSREAKAGANRWPLHIGMIAIALLLATFSEDLKLNMFAALGVVLLLLGNAVALAGLAKPRPSHETDSQNLHVWDFTHKIWTGAAFATLGSILFTLGIMAIGAAINVLFGLNVQRLIQDFILPIGLGFLAPVYWLSTIPPVDEDFAELYENPAFVSKAVSFLGTWILAPLTLIYALILLAYGAKIGLSGTIPRGEIAPLTIPFLIIGTLTWLLLEPPFIRDKGVAKLFRKAWFPLALPAVILLAVAIGVRLSEYGVTPQRLALVTLVVWSLGIGVVFTFAKPERRDIRLIPGFAALLLGLCTLSMGWISQWNQAHRLKTNLVAAGILQADGTLSAGDAISDEDAASDAKGALRYLLRNNGEKAVASVLAKANLDMKVEEDTLALIQDALSLDKVAETKPRKGEIQYGYYNPGYVDVDIASYTHLYGPISGSVGSNMSRDGMGANKTLDMKFDKTRLEFYVAEAQIADFDIQAWMQAQSFIDSEIKVDAPHVVVYEAGAQKIAINVSQLSLQTDPGQNDGAVSGRFDVFILTTGF